jgi:predicted Zn-dependent protease
MPAFFERLQLANRLIDDPNLPEFLRTHPVTVSRIADSRNRAEQFPRRRYEDSLSFELMRTKLKVSSMNKSEAVKYYLELLRTGDPRHDSAARYGYALALIQAGEYGKARAQIAQLLQGDSSQLAYLLAAARLNLLEGRTEEALTAYARAVVLYPEYRPVTLGYTKALLAAGQADKARRFLRKYAVDHEPDSAYYVLLAEAEGKAGSEVEAHIAMAEAHYLSGETGLARERLRFAQRSPQVDHYQRQRIEARLKEIERELKEEKKEKWFNSR